MKTTSAPNKQLLHHFAFNNSAQANIISTESDGKIIAANKTACKLLGYSKKELLTKGRADIFAIKENSFKKMLRNRTAEGHLETELHIIKKSGEVFLCQVTSAVFIESGIEKSITTITDMSAGILKQKNIDINKEKIVANNIALAKSKQKKIDSINRKAVAGDIALAKSKQNKIDLKKEKIVAHDIIMALAKSEDRLAENNEWIKYISKASYDVMWDWNIATGEVYVSDSAKEVFGYKVEKNTIQFTDFARCLLPQEKDIVEKKLRKTLASIDKTWNDSFRFIRKDGFVATVASRASIIRDEEGNAVRLIGAVQDVSRLEELEMKLKKSSATIALMTRNSLKQKKTIAQKDKLVAKNIVLAIAAQIDIDTANKKTVAQNIMLAISRQMVIDTANKKKVTENIALAVANQKNIDAEKEKRVALNIVQALVKQKHTDTRNRKIVAENIAEAKAKQKGIDLVNKKIVADNILVSIARQIEIDAKNKKIVAKNIVQAIAKQIKIDAKNKKIVARNIALAISHQKDIDIKKEKKVAANIVLALLNQKEKDAKNEKQVAENIVLAQTTSDVRLAESNKKFLLAAKLSNDVIWDWNLLTNEVFFGESFEELFGYLIPNNRGNITDWSDYVHREDKNIVEKELYDAIASSDNNWEHAYRFIRFDGSIAKVFARASIMRNADGTAYRLIGTLQDLSRQKELEGKLGLEMAEKQRLRIENDEKFKLIFNSSSDILYDNDLKTGIVVISDGYEKEYGHKITGNMTPAVDWVSHIHPDDQKAVFQNYLEMLDSEDKEWKYSYRFLTTDNSIVNVTSNAVILRHNDGKAYRVIGSMQDNSKQIALEEKLEQEIILKEKQIAEAIDDAKDTQRSELGKELHDNVNQLLGASRMYLEMAKRGGPDSEKYISQSSEYTLTAIEEIRKLSKGLVTDYIKNLGLCEAIEIIARDTMEINPLKISCALDNFLENRVNDKFKLNVYRVVQEQLNNILKHAKATNVTISLSQNKKSIMLIISDDGVGFVTSKKQKGIGVANIKSRAASYSGTADFTSQPGQGCVLNITFPVTEALMNS